jgi:hypothetical protein
MATTKSNSHPPSSTITTALVATATTSLMVLLDYWWESTNGWFGCQGSMASSNSTTLMDLAASGSEVVALIHSVLLTRSFPTSFNSATTTFVLTIAMFSKLTTTPSTNFDAITLVIGLTCFDLQLERLYLYCLSCLRVLSPESVRY